MRKKNPPEARMQAEIEGEGNGQDGGPGRRCKTEREMGAHRQAIQRPELDQPGTGLYRSWDGDYEDLSEIIGLPGEGMLCIHHGETLDAYHDGDWERFLLLASL